jgi:hypothetical protein
MTSRLRSALLRTIRPRTSRPVDDVHFHLGGDGNPFVCDLQHCQSPALSLSDMGPAHRAA